MWKAIDHIDPITKSASAAALCTLLRQYLSTRNDELLSEILCWATLPMLFRNPRRLEIDRTKNATPFSSAPQSLPSSFMWIIAAGLVAYFFLQVEIDLAGITPALTPALFIAQNFAKFSSQSWRTSDSSSSTTLASRLCSLTLVSLFSTLALSNWDIRASAFAIIPTLVFISIYVVLFSQVFKSSVTQRYVSVYKTIHSISLRAFFIFIIVLGVQSVMFEYPRISMASTISLGLVKSMSWYFIIQTVQHSHWCIVTVVGTFSLASASNPFMQISEAHALSHVFTSILALGNMIQILPKNAKARFMLWTLSVASLVPYLLNVIAIKSAQSAASHFSLLQEHPVETLMLKSKKNFDDILGRQSKNYTAAHNEYQRRYDIQPPSGFKAWFEFAMAHESPIIDEFDTIHEQISPFLKMSGIDVAKIISDAHEISGTEAWLCERSGDDAKTSCSHPYRTCDRDIQRLFNTLLGTMKDVLPDIKFLVNHLDEPRVIISSSNHGKSISTQSPGLSLKNMARQPVWSDVTKVCSLAKQFGKETLDVKVDTFGLPFVTDVDSSMDLCRHPEYRSMHGLFMSPASFPIMEGPVPILSTGSPSTMGDILFPSPAYLQSEFAYDEKYDIDWESKRNNLYWAGSTTGGVAVDDKWMRYHRQRFVSLAQNLGHQKYHYLREKKGLPTAVESSFLNGRLFDVAFTRILHCDAKFCRDQKTNFKMKFWQDKDQAFGSQLVFDMDGNGISGRYYKLLASKSVPLKQTLLREWHDDRLMPWVHYIPVSQSLKEIPELVTYLTSTKKGQTRAREVAEQGRDWFSKAFREIDLTIYTYRLMLELVRLQDLERKAYK